MATSSASSSTQKDSIPLPENRFELELEFVQALASPAYLHFLATTKTEEGDRLLLQEPAFQAYLRYLFQTWSKPEYSRFLSYPHALYFLELIIEKPSVIVKEWTLPQFRNFCHQQQFLAWQHRHANLYGRGTVHEEPQQAASGA
jgi:mediator of RNA polymerase II transcription subunit 31